MKIPAISAMGAIAALGGLEPGMYYSLPNRRAREKKEFTAFDQERLDKAAEKRARKAAKRLRDTQLD